MDEDVDAINVSVQPDLFETAVGQPDPGSPPILQPNNFIQSDVQGAVYTHAFLYVFLFYPLTIVFIQVVLGASMHSGSGVGSPSCIHLLGSSTSGIEDDLPYLIYETPNGTRFWRPKVAEMFKPVPGTTFTKLEDALLMYREYAAEAGFSVRIAQQKKKLGQITHKYLRCNRASKPQQKRKFDTLDESSLFMRQSSFRITDCKAHILLQFKPDSTNCIVLNFVEIHNHPLVEKYNRDLTKLGRQLAFESKQFIHKMSLNRIGPTVSHRLLVSLKGGHQNVQGTPTDFKNFGQSIRLHIGDRDSTLLLERLRERSENYTDFYYDFSLVDGELRSVFWADEISKINYEAFGDVLAFDATYHTNKYNMIFVPFTGVDHHKKCVTFGAGLLFNETVDSYKWLLTAFLKAHGKQPVLVLSDQDPSMNIAIPAVFTESRHRLCMWHIMKKLPTKVSGYVLENTNLRSSIHRLVWSVYMKESTFEEKWGELIKQFGLEDNNWLNDMYAIRSQWIPAFFRDLPMCCLMKTTSRCESTNSSFKVNSSGSNTLVQFMLCFDTTLESQRYRQRLSEFKSASMPYATVTRLPIEKHAFDMYTHAIFIDVRKEIAKGKLWCYISDRKQEDDVAVFSVTHLNKNNETINVFEVRFDMTDNSATCSCRCFTRIGYLCRHVFCVYRVCNVQRIPECYLSKRWMKDVLPKRIFSIENRYGVDNSPVAALRNEILDLITDCVYFLRNDTDALSNFANQLKVLKESILQQESPNNVADTNNDLIIEDLLGQELNVDVTVSNPQGIRNKGCGKTRRVVGAAESAVENSQKTPRLCRTCNKYVIGHDSRNCKKVTEANAESQKQKPTLRKSARNK